MTDAWEKCDLLGLDDEKEILDNISEEVGLEKDQIKEEKQNKEDCLEETREEDYIEEFEDKASNDDADIVHHPLLWDIPDDIQFDEGPIVFPYLP